MIDHITFGVSDFCRSVEFYDLCLAPLGIRRLFETKEQDARAVGYGDERPWFWIAERSDKLASIHIAIRARGHEEVIAFHQAAIAAGGQDNGAPGFRPQYQPGYYSAFVLDPDGNNIEAVIRELNQ